MNKTFLFGLILSLSLPLTALAAPSYGNFLGEVGQNAGLATTGGAPTQDVVKIIGTVLNVALGLLGAVLLLITIYAGFLWMTAGGNDEQVAKAKSWIKNAVIGLLLTLTAYSISSFVVDQISRAASGTAPAVSQPTSTP